MSQACKEFVERVAGRIRHRRMQGREERESEEGLDIVEDDESDDEDPAPPSKKGEAELYPDISVECSRQGVEQGKDKGNTPFFDLYF